MKVTIGLREVQPWGTPEWVTVRATKTLDLYSVIFDPHKFDIVASNDEELIDRITKKLRVLMQKAP
jgi:precorrin-2 methylase